MRSRRSASPLEDFTADHSFVFLCCVRNTVAGEVIVLFSGKLQYFQKQDEIVHVEL